MTWSWELPGIGHPTEHLNDSGGDEAIVQTLEEKRLIVGFKLLVLPSQIY